MKMSKRTAEIILRCLDLDNIDRLDIKSAIAIALEVLENLPDEVTVETCGGDDEEGNMDIDGIKVTVTGDPYPGEIEGYVRRGQREHGQRLTAMEITLDGADCDIMYILKRPFERIRRITGYLQKTEQWNSAKQAELKDRVTHAKPENETLPKQGTEESK